MKLNLLGLEGNIISIHGELRNLEISITVHICANRHWQDMFYLKLGIHPPRDWWYNFTRPFWSIHYFLPWFNQAPGHINLKILWNDTYFLFITRLLDGDIQFTLISVVPWRLQMAIENRPKFARITFIVWSAAQEIVNLSPSHLYAVLYLVPSGPTPGKQKTNIITGYVRKGSDESITGKGWRWNKRNLEWQLWFPEAMARIPLWRQSYNQEIKWYAICGFIPMWFPIRSQTLVVRSTRSDPIINTLKPKALPQHCPEDSQTSPVSLTLIDVQIVIIIVIKQLSMLQGGNHPSMKSYPGCHLHYYPSLGHPHNPLMT